MKVALIQGGIGSERDVSRVTGAGFAQALRELGHNFEVVEADEHLASRLEKMRPDVALLALHGKFGEDGTVQGICEYLKIPYSGSGILASSLCMDKGYLKDLMRAYGIPTPHYQLVDLRKISLDTFKPTLSVPLVVKPCRDGSSVGISMVRDAQDLIPAMREAGVYDHYVLLEEMIVGREITVPIVNGKVLTSIEIEPKQGFYDYQNKYTAGRTEYHLPARIPASALAEVEATALKLFEICRLRNFARMDFMIDSAGRPLVIEVNALPGCTPTSLLPKSAAHSGISFPQLIDIFVKSAGLDYAGLR